MAEVLVITASPRKKSNSAKIAEELVKILQFKTSETVNINSLKITPCSACGSCVSSFSCVYKDAAPRLISKIKKAKVIIIASPVYFCGVPAPLKAFIDRNQPEWERHNKKTSTVNKKGIIILTAGGNEKKYFLPAKREIASMFAVNGIKTLKVLTFGGMDETGAAEKSRDIMKKIRAAAGSVNGLR